MQCAPGTYGGASGLMACALCAPGTFAPAKSAKRCERCGVGSYSPRGGAHQCMLCAPGTYADVSGLVVCALCLPHSYQNQSGAAACMPCGAGLASMAGASVCEVCPGWNQGMVAAAADLLLANVSEAEDDIVYAQQTFESFLDHYMQQPEALLPQTCVDLYARILARQRVSTDSSARRGAPPAARLLAAVLVVQLLRVLRLSYVRI